VMASKTPRTTRVDLLRSQEKARIGGRIKRPVFITLLEQAPGEGDSMGSA
jgi:hypothetical protein